MGPEVLERTARPGWLVILCASLWAVAVLAYVEDQDMDVDMGAESAGARAMQPMGGGVGVDIEIAQDLHEAMEMESKTVEATLRMVDGVRDHEEEEEDDDYDVEMGGGSLSDVLKSLEQVSGSSKVPHQLPQPYHSTQQAFDFLTQLNISYGGEGCHGRTFQLEWKQYPTEKFPNGKIPVVRWSVKGDPEPPRKKALLVFGEHGREFISVEVGMFFLAHIAAPICAADDASIPSSNDDAKPKPSVISGARTRQALQDWDLTILLVGSPSARIIAEENDFCNRPNGDGVDVNRNYPLSDYRRNATKMAKMGSSEYGGNNVLSEPETALLAQIAQKERPNVFLSVHAGSQLVISSPAYKTATMDELPSVVQHILNTIKEKNCPNCKAGPASELLSYLTEGGCSMDYMTDQMQQWGEVPYSFTFESWDGVDEAEATSRQMQTLDDDFNKDDAAIVLRQQMDWEALLSSVSLKEKDCLVRFSPSPCMYHLNVRRWTNALISVMDIVGKEKK